MRPFKVFINCFLVVFLLAKLAACNFAPGSYPYAEEYELSVNEPELIQAIQEFKLDNPQFNVPATTQLNDGRRNEAGQNYWYHIYFYYSDENKIVKCWTRPINKEKTTFAFVGINDGLELGNWQMINKNFDNSQNQIEIKKFEERILSRIKNKL